MVPRREGESMECKVGIVYSQRAEISRNRIALLGKRTYASFDGAATFGERFWVHAAARGVATARQIVFLSDGAEWFRTLRAAYFPPALFVLDPWHLERRLREVWGVEAGALIQRCLREAWRGDVRPLLRRLRGGGEDGGRARHPSLQEARDGPAL